MKRFFSLFMAVLILISSLCISVIAATDDSTLAPIENSFIRTATVSVSTYGDGLTEISLTSTEVIPTVTCSTSNETSYKSSSLTFLADTPEERNDILTRINQARRGGGTAYDEDWFLGSSCYIYVSIAYTTRKVGAITEARINTVTTRDSVNSGTYISSAQLVLSCIGESSDQGSVALQERIQVTTSPYRTTRMSTWPYINVNTPSLSAVYEVTAMRASGASSTHMVAATVINN